MCGQDLATFLALDSGREGPGGAGWMGGEMVCRGRDGSGAIPCLLYRVVTKEVIAGIECMRKVG